MRQCLTYALFFVEIEEKSVVFIIFQNQMCCRRGDELIYAPLGLTKRGLAKGKEKIQHISLF